MSTELGFPSHKAVSFVHIVEVQLYNNSLEEGEGASSYVDLRS